MKAAFTSFMVDAARVVGVLLLALSLLDLLRYLAFLVTIRAVLG